MDKYEYIRRLAVFLTTNETTMDVKNLAKHLNWNGYRTDKNELYKGGRGTYTLIHKTYDWLVSLNEQDDADAVARAYMKSNRTYAYDK